MSRYRIYIRKYYTKEETHYIHADTEEEARENLIDQIKFNYHNYDKFDNPDKLTWEENDAILAVEKLKEWDKNGREIKN